MAAGSWRHQVLIPHADADGREAQPDQGARGDDRGTERSHRQLLQRKKRAADRAAPARPRDLTPAACKNRSHVAAAHYAGEDQQDAGDDHHQAAATASGIGPVGSLGLVPAAATDRSSRSHAHIIPLSVRGRGHRAAHSRRTGPRSPTMTESGAAPPVPCANSSLRPFGYTHLH